MQVSIEVPSNAETICTGYAGAVILESRGKTYRVEILTTGKLRSATCSTGANIEDWPHSVHKRLARTAAIYFPPRG